MGVSGDLEVRETLPELRRAGAGWNNLQRCLSAPPLSLRKIGCPGRLQRSLRLGTRATFSSSSPTSLQDLLVAQGWSWGRLGGPRPTAPSRPHAGPRGKAHGHRLRRANSCLITFYVAPLFVFIVPESERISELKLKKPICFQ